MTLLGNSVKMSRQEENDPFLGNKRSKRSMRERNQRPHQEGGGSRIASHAVHTPPLPALFSLFTCPDKISQQSHLSRPPPIYRPLRAFKCISCRTIGTDHPQGTAQAIGSI